jgi:lysophosphatidate acyltransferase
MVDHEMLNDFIRATLWVLYVIGRIIFYYACTIPVFSIASTRQEYKLWKKTATPLTIWGIFKVFIFNIIWMASCLAGALALVPMWMMLGCGNSVEVEANAVVEKLVACGLVEAIIGTVEIINGDKIPPVSFVNGDAPAPIFIANHCSQLDISAVYYIVRRFKWIAKKSVRFIPGPGNLMSLGAHIFIQRSGKKSKSVSNLYQLSNEAIQAGVPMVLFPQGTRCMHKKLPFKDGAFRIAAENESVLVPITIDIPANCWNSFYPVNLLWGQKRGEVNKIIATVHDPIPVKKDADIKALKEKCQDIIYSVLPPRYHGKTDDDNRKQK